MYFDFAEIAPGNYAKLLNATVVPRPIAWVVSKSAEGVLNAAPFSYFNVFSGNPPIIGIGIGSRDGSPKDSSANILATREFVVNLVSYETRHLMNISGADYDAGISEIERAGLTIIDGVNVSVPRIAESPVALECKLHETVNLENHRHIVIGRVVGVYIRDDMVLNPERCYVDTPRLDLIGRLHGAGWYARVSDLFDMPRLSVEQAEEASAGR